MVLQKFKRPRKFCFKLSYFNTIPANQQSLSGQIMWGAQIVNLTQKSSILAYKKSKNTRQVEYTVRFHFWQQESGSNKQVGNCACIRVPGFISRQSCSRLSPVQLLGYACRLLTESLFLFVDLSVLNISSRALSPDSIEVKWEPPKGADNSITYKVFQRQFSFTDHEKSFPYLIVEACLCSGQCFV